MHDTTRTARLRQITVLRRLGIEGRMGLTFQLCESLRQTAESGIRCRHPEYDERQVRLARLRLNLGAKRFARCHPEGDLAP